MTDPIDIETDEGTVELLDNIRERAESLVGGIQRPRVLLSEIAELTHRFITRPRTQPEPDDVDVAIAAGMAANASALAILMDAHHRLLTKAAFDAATQTRH